MNITDYLAIKNKIQSDYPAGLSYNDMNNIEKLWKKLTGNKLPEDFDITYLYTINLDVAGQHLSSHRAQLSALYSKRHMTDITNEILVQVDRQISDLYSLIYKLTESIKMSEYGIYNKEE